METAWLRVFLIVAAFVSSSATAQSLFTTHYVDVGSGRSNVAIAASPVDGSIFVAAVSGKAESGDPTSRIIKTDQGGNTVAAFDLQFTVTAITVDPAGNPLVVGSTANFARFPSTAQLAPNLSGTAAFVIKVDSSLSRIMSAVLLGGSATTRVGFPIGAAAAAVATDPGGNVYVTGTTDVTDFPTSAGAYMATVSGGSTDLSNPIYSFVTKLTPDLSAIVFSTYYGKCCTATLYAGWTWAGHTGLAQGSLTATAK